MPAFIGIGSSSGVGNWFSKLTWAPLQPAVKSANPTNTCVASLALLVPLVSSGALNQGIILAMLLLIGIG